MCKISMKQGLFYTINWDQEWIIWDQNKAQTKPKLRSSEALRWVPADHVKVHSSGLYVGLFACKTTKHGVLFEAH